MSAPVAQKSAAASDMELATTMAIQDKKDIVD